MDLWRMCIHVSRFHSIRLNKRLKLHHSSPPPLLSPSISIQLTFSLLFEFEFEFECMCQSHSLFDSFHCVNFHFFFHYHTSKYRTRVAHIFLFDIRCCVFFLSLSLSNELAAITIYLDASSFRFDVLDEAYNTIIVLYCALQCEHTDEKWNDPRSFEPLET